MKRNETAVRDRLMAAIALHKDESPGLPITVSKICRMAGVNRANVYANHSDILLELQRAQIGRPVRRNKNKASNKTFKVELESLRRQNKALIYLCMELQSSVNDLTRRAQTVARKKL